MKRLICAIRGHATVRVSRVGVVARPGGILPTLDGAVAYKPDPAGDHTACTRCRQVDPR